MAWTEAGPHLYIPVGRRQIKWEIKLVQKHVETSYCLKEKELLRFAELFWEFLGTSGQEVKNLISVARPRNNTDWSLKQPNGSVP